MPSQLKNVFHDKSFFESNNQTMKRKYYNKKSTNIAKNLYASDNIILFRKTVCIYR